jgi:hypothetical protein
MDDFGGLSSSGTVRLTKGWFGRLLHRARRTYATGSLYAFAEFGLQAAAGHNCGIIAG